MRIVVELITKFLMALTGQKYEKPLPGILDRPDPEAERRLGFSSERSVVQEQRRCRSHYRGLALLHAVWFCTAETPRLRVTPRARSIERAAFTSSKPITWP